VFQVKSYGAVVLEATTVPFISSSTRWTPTASEAVDRIVTFPETDAPFTGEVTVAVGGVVSGTVLLTVTDTELSALTLFELSVALAEIVWLLLDTVAEFQVVEYGGVVSVENATPESSR
jgi:hypothetical protein